jgi:DNA-binding LytR/AlgR family response regulator
VQGIRGLRFTAVAAGFSLVAAAYCLAHGLVIDDELNLPRTLAWAVASTFPWVCAWEGLKRLDARPAQPLQPLLAAALLIAALVVSAALQSALTQFYAADSDSLAQIVYRLLPIPFGIVVVRWLLRSSKPARADTGSPTERLRESQLERVLDVPTRRGVLAVRACDIEYVKAAGNYVELITGDRTLLMRVTLQELSEQLGLVGFVRVHRSLLVNSLHVVAARRRSGGRGVVELRSGTELPVGRQFGDNAATFVPTARRSSRQH